MTLLEAKERVRIPDLWREFGYDGEPKKQGRCPFHEDKSPSFSVFDEGKKWKCFAGCGEGSVIDFYARAKGVPEDEACLEILRRAGEKSGLNSLNSQPKRESSKAITIVNLPPLQEYSKDIAQRVADSRGLNITAVEFAYHWLKTLLFAKVCDFPSWILTDATQRCVEARRIDRKPYPPIGTLCERKSHTLAGSSKSWPVGILMFDEPWLQKDCQKMVVVEGGPDYLAACQLIASQEENVLPVAMMGASQSICEDALPYFKGRHVTIVAHPDEAGRGAAERWAKQIQWFGGLPRIFKLKKGDLCDIVAAGATHDDLRLF